MNRRCVDCRVENYRVGLISEYAGVSGTRYVARPIRLCPLILAYRMLSEVDAEPNKILASATTTFLAARSPITRALELMAIDD